MISIEEDRARRNERIRQIRQQWIDENGPCRECGSFLDLEVDHIDPSTKDPLLVGKRKGVQQNLWFWSRSRREVELAKCQVLCHWCHKAKTQRERMKTHCGNGHEWTPENTYMPYGQITMRQCKICKRERGIKYREAKRASV